jgi:hypothetical protein
MQSKLAVGVVFVIGCVAGGAASQMVVPKARAGTNPPRWEYVCGESENEAIPLAQLNKAGAEGWELAWMLPNKMRGGVGFLDTNDIVYCMKRPMP